MPLCCHKDLHVCVCGYAHTRKVVSCEVQHWALPLSRHSSTLKKPHGSLQSVVLFMVLNIVVTRFRLCPKIGKKPKVSR